MTSPEQVLVPRPELVAEWFEDALLVWDEASERLHHLDLRAALVWAELDGRPIGVVADALSRDFSEAAVRQDVLTLCDRLLTEGLLTAPVV